MADTTDLKKGVVIEREGKNWLVQEAFFVSPGKGSAFYRTKLKDIATGKVIEHTYKSGEGINLVEIERRTATYLYQNAETFFFMDEESFEQYEYDEAFLGSTKQYLKENQLVIILFAQGNPVNVTFPKSKIGFEVTEAPPAIKGDTVSSSFRPVTIETGATVQVPLFITTGDRIIVNTDTGEYCEREKK